MRLTNIQESSESILAYEYLHSTDNQASLVSANFLAPNRTHSINSPTKHQKQQ